MELYLNYFLGSDLDGVLVRDVPRLPNNNINNAVSDVDDDNYLQRGDRGENVGSDLLRSATIKFFDSLYVYTTLFLGIRVVFCLVCILF